MQGNEGRDKRKVPQMTGMTVSETLNKAADHIQRYGHWKRNAFGPGPSGKAAACTVAAIGVACGSDCNAAVPAWGQMATYLGDPDIVGWNDAPERAAEEVVATLRAAALVAAANESQPSVEAVRA